MMTDFITVEAKRGYNKDNLFNMLDRQVNKNRSGFEDWLNQAVTASERAGTPHWMIIARRTQKQAMVYFPTKLFDLLKGEQLFRKLPRPFVQIRAAYKNDQKETVKVNFVGMLLADFFRLVPARNVRVLSRRELPRTKK